jgi:hypothetical protein
VRALGFASVGVAISMAFAGCSLFVSLDGLGTSDGGSEAGTPDTTADLGAPEAYEASDAGPDVFDFVCPDASIVCDDFDDDPLGKRWSSSNMSGAQMAIDDGGSVSPPNSLMLTLPANPNGNSRDAYLAKTFSSRSTIDCDFDVKVDMTTATTMYDVRPIEFDINANGYSYYEFWLNLSATDLSFEQSLHVSDPDAGGKNPTFTVMSPLDTSKWHHIHFSSDFKRVKIEVDGMVSLDRALVDPIGASSGVIHFGLAYDAEPPSWSYRVDDIYCR